MGERVGGAGPDPTRAADIAEFVEVLNELRVWAGSPSYRALAKVIGPRLKPPQALSQSTVGDLFQSRRRRLNLDLVIEIARALGLDAAGVARWRAACVRVHAEAKAGGPVGALRQLPADLATFTGREADLARLERAVEGRAEGGARTVTILAIEGMGGTGKTQLAVHAAHRLVAAGRYTDVQLFVNLRGFDAEQDPADPLEVLGAFLQALEVPIQRIPPGLDERAAVFRDRINGRRALVVLDNAAGMAQVRSLIPGGPDNLVLITSRRSIGDLDGAVPHRLGLFTPAEAQALLSRIAGVERVAAEPAAAARIGRLCGHLPLAVALVAARLRSRPAWRLSDLVKDLHQAGLKGLRTGGRDVSTILGLSYDCLPQPARTAFRLLSLHPGEDLSVGAAAALTGLSSVDAQEVLEMLLDEHLLQQAVIDRYQFHDLVRLHGRHLASEDPESSRSAALVRLLDHYRQAVSAAMDLLIPYERARRPAIPASSDVEPVVFHDAADAEAWLHGELANVVQAVDVTADGSVSEQVGDISTILARYLEVRGLHRAALVLHHRAAEATDGEPASDRQADIARSLGGTYWQLGRFQEATEYYERALIRYRASENLVGMAATSGNLGMLAAHQGRSLPALNHFRRAQSLFAQAGDLVGESRALSCLGNAHRRRGRYTESIECFDRAIDLVRLTAAHSDAAGTALANRGVTRTRQGDYARARQDLLEALAVLREGGHDALGNELLTDLGILQIRLNQPEEALASLTQSLNNSRDNGHQAAEGWALLGLSELHYTSRRPTEALAVARDALTLAEAIGEYAIKVHAHNHLGRAETALGRLQSAAEHHRTASGLTRAIGDVYQRAKALDGLADIYRRRSEPELAAHYGQLALRAYRRLGVPEAGGSRPLGTLGVGSPQ
jgi:tetratricopeptide (TPR) repeat protein